MSDYICKPRVCSACAGEGWLSITPEGSRICRSCWGGGAIIIPIKKQIDKLVDDITGNNEEES